MIQGPGEGIRGPAQVAQGGTIEVDVGPNDTTVEIGEAGVGDSKSFTVDKGKHVSIPVPPVPPNTLLYVTVGTGLKSRIIVVEVIATD